jgi:hypothetical protein
MTPRSLTWSAKGKHDPAARLSATRPLDRIVDGQADTRQRGDDRTVSSIAISAPDPPLPQCLLVSEQGDRSGRSCSVCSVFGQAESASATIRPSPMLGPLARHATNGLPCQIRNLAVAA